jgi:hypothetical protein
MEALPTFLERLPYKQEVRGSSPRPPTICFHQFTENTLAQKDFLWLQKYTPVNGGICKNGTLTAHLRHIFSSRVCLPVEPQFLPKTHPAAELSPYLSRGRAQKWFPQLCRGYVVLILWMGVADQSRRFGVMFSHSETASENYATHKVVHACHVRIGARTSPCAEQWQDSRFGSLFAH